MVSVKCSSFCHFALEILDLSISVISSGDKCILCHPASFSMHVSELLLHSLPHSQVCVLFLTVLP